MQDYLGTFLKYKTKDENMKEYKQYSKHRY